MKRKIEQLIFDGYLKGYISINGINIVLKSLTEDEYREIDDLKIFSDYFHAPLIILFSICRINRINFVKLKEEHFEELYEYIKTLPVIVTQKILEVISEMNEYIYKNSHEDFKKYVDSTDSKINFTSFMMNKSPLSNGSLNIIQKLWLSNNYYEEKNELIKTAWSFTKFIGGMFNPKAVRKIDALEKSGEDFKEYTKEEIKASDGLLRSVGSKEEIVRELRREMRGEKDLHDIVIEAYEKKQQEILDERKEKSKNTYEKHVDEMGEGVYSESRVIDATIIKDMERIKKERLSSFKSEAVRKLDDIAKKNLAKFKDQI